MTVGATDFLEYRSRECWATDADELAAAGVYQIPIMAKPIVGGGTVKRHDANVVRAPSHPLPVEYP